MNRQTKHFYDFGPFRFESEQRVLLRDGKPVPLPPKVAETLLLLVQNPGQLMEKEDLIRGLWPDTFVEEGNLNKNIFILRKALAHWDGGREYVETVPKRGYRFVATVNRQIEESTSSPIQVSMVAKEIPALTKAPRRAKYIIAVFGLAMALGSMWLAVAHRREQPASPGAATIHSLAVLPLENLSGDPAQDYFADGMTDELITNLGQIASLRIISRTSVMQYKGVHKALPLIGHELNVDGVVEGTVMRSGNQVRITAQLIEARSDTHLWARSYEGDLSDVLTLQRQVAGDIADQIRIKLTPQQRTALTTARIVNPEALEDYLLGRHLAQTGSIDGYTKSIAYFKRAIHRDPHTAVAYAALADSYVLLGHMVSLPPQQAFPTAREAALKALQLDDSLSEAHQELANVKFLYDWDFPAAEHEFRRAIELNPNSVTAHAYYADYLIAMGRVNESLAQRKQNLQIDPLALRPVWGLATGYYWAHRYDEAIAEARKAIAMDPDHWSGHLDLGLALEQKHEFPLAIAELRKALETSHDRMWVIFIAHDKALSGDKAGAERVIAELQRLSTRTYVSPWLFAMTYPDLGEKDKAFLWLETCYKAREHDLVFSKAWPMFDSLRSDKRYQNLMRRVGLPQ